VLEQLISTYGYLAILVGTFLEGETILVLGGFAAHRGYLHLPWVILAAFVGTLAGDQLFFFIGRLRGQALLARHPAWQARIEKVNRLLERYQTLLILAFRFVYGIRTSTPFVIGMSRVKTGYFVLLNTIGAMAWAIAIATAGYLLGNAVEAILGDIKRYEIGLMGIIAVGAALAWTVRSIYRRRVNNRC
jgi:membrane protein DedA with SNARE-associated domain